MKKIVALLALVLIYSCSPEEKESKRSEAEGVDIGNEYTFPDTISPPSWLRGTWVEAKGTELKISDNNISCDCSGNFYSAKGEISYYQLQDQDPEIVEKKTDSTYTLQYKISASDKRTYNFIKTSSNQMQSKGAYKGIYTRK